MAGRAYPAAPDAATEHRIIAEADDNGHWSAWFADAPQDACGGRSGVQALRRLIDSSAHRQLDTATLRADSSRSRGDHFEFTVRSDRSAGRCAECGGTGRYVGLRTVEPCRACAGAVG